MTPIPLRLPRRVFWLGGGALGLLGIVLIVGGHLSSFVDFPTFWVAGRVVGTPDLIDLKRLIAYEDLYGVRANPWPYPAGSAWLFVPFSAWAMPVGFWLHAAFMTGCVAVAGFIGAQTFGLDRRVGVVAAFAWTPTMASAIYGQNAAFALVLALLVVEGLRRDNDWLAGVGAGLMLYKPTLALPLIGLLLLRRRWRAVWVVAAAAGGWYLAGVAAAAGDWGWPSPWLSAVNGWYGTDTRWNVVRTLSTPGVLQGLGAPAVVALGVGAAIVVAAIPRLLRAPLAEAAAGAMLVGLAVSPHALNYEGALMLPILLWALGGVAGTGLAEPWRTRLVVGAVVLAPQYLFSETVGLSILAPIVLLATLIWIAGPWRAAADSARPTQPSGQPISA